MTYKRSFYVTDRFQQKIQAYYKFQVVNDRQSLQKVQISFLRKRNCSCNQNLQENELVEHQKNEHVLEVVKALLFTHKVLNYLWEIYFMTKSHQSSNSQKALNMSSQVPSYIQANTKSSLQKYLVVQHLSTRKCLCSG